MRQGETSSVLPIILRGRVAVERSRPDLAEPIQIAEVAAGEIVGEMGALNKEARSATVTAIEETETLALEGSLLMAAAYRFPALLVELVRILSQRLRTTDEALLSLVPGLDPDGIQVVTDGTTLRISERPG